MSEYVRRSEAGKREFIAIKFTACTRSTSSTSNAAPILIYRVSGRDVCMLVVVGGGLCMEFC